MKIIISLALILNFTYLIAQTYSARGFQYTSYIEIENYNSLFKERKGQLYWNKEFLLNFNFPFYDSLYNYIECRYTGLCSFKNEPDFGIRLFTFGYDYEYDRFQDSIKPLSDLRYKLTTKNGLKALVLQYTRLRLISDNTVSQFDSYINMQHWFYEDGSIEVRFGESNLKNCPNYLPGSGFFLIVNNDSLVNIGPEVGLKHPFNPNDQTYMSGEYSNYNITNSFEDYLTTIPPKGWVIRFEKKPLETEKITFEKNNCLSKPS